MGMYQTSPAVLQNLKLKIMNPAFHTNKESLILSLNTPLPTSNQTILQSALLLSHGVMFHSRFFLIPSMNVASSRSQLVLPLLSISQQPES